MLSERAGGFLSYSVIFGLWPYLVLYLQVFPTLGHKPVTVDLAIGSEKRLKIFFSSADGYHIIDAESEVMSDVTLPNNVRSLENIFLPQFEFFTTVKTLKGLKT